MADIKRLVEEFKRISERAIPGGGFSGVDASDSGGGVTVEGWGGIPGKAAP